MERQTNWRDEALRLLQQRPANLRLETVAEACGVSVGWLRAFMRGAIKEPSVNSVETLITYLKAVK